MKALAITILLAASGQVLASSYDPMIDAAAMRHGVDRIVLRAIAQHESRKHPWVFNADGEPFRFDDKNATVQALWGLSQVPWMVKARPIQGKGSRRFFHSQQAAQAYASRLATMSSLKLRTDDRKEVDRGEIRVRKLRMKNTDLGIAQINYRWHDAGTASVQRWLDPAYNLDYAASYLARLKREHGTDLNAVRFYHDNRSEFQKAYMADFMPKYEQEKRNARISLAASR